jgi:hypothetical protein
LSVTATSGLAAGLNGGQWSAIESTAGIPAVFGPAGAINLRIALFCVSIQKADPEEAVFEQISRRNVEGL